MISMYVLRVIGWGVVIYAIVQLFGNMFRLFVFATGFGNVYVLYIIIVATTIGVAYAAGTQNFSESVRYGIGWVMVVWFFDWLIYFQIQGIAMYQDPRLWLGYLLVAVSPALMLGIGRLARDLSVTSRSLESPMLPEHLNH